MEPISLSLIAAEAYLLFRRAWQLYSMYNLAVDTVADVTNKASPSADSQQYVVGEDVYLYLLGFKMFGLTKLNSIIVAEHRAAIIASAILASHARVSSQHYVAVVDNFLLQLGRLCYQYDSQTYQLVVDYRKKLSEIKGVHDPIASIISKEKEFGLSQEDLNVVHILSGGIPFTTITALFKAALESEDLASSYKARISRYETEKIGVHKIELSVSVFEQGMRSAFPSSSTTIRLSSAGTPVSLLMGVTDPTPANRPVTRFDNTGFTGITKNMTQAMGDVLTRHAGFVRADNDRFVHQINTTLVRDDKTSESVFKVITDDTIIGEKDPLSVVQDEMSSFVEGKMEQAAKSGFDKALKRLTRIARRSIKRKTKL